MDDSQISDVSIQVGHGQQLRHIAYVGDVKKCKELLSKRANTENADIYGWTPLYIAANRGHIDICKLLLQAGASVNHVDKNGMTSLSEAARRGYQKICELLLEAGAEVNHADINDFTPLSEAARRGHDKVCELLLQAGAEVDDVDYVVGQTPLFYAIIWGHEKVCDVLLKAGAAVNHVNKMGDTPLSWAASREDYKICRLLITKYGADCRNSSFSKYLDKMLIWAAVKKDMKMIAPLIDAGADINLKTLKGKTLVDHILASNKRDDPVYKMVALYNAAREGNHRFCEELIESNTDTNLTDKEGMTPLFFVCNDGNISLVEKLISKGANVNAAGCLQRSLDLYYNDVAQTLIENGCDVNQVNIHSGNIYRSIIVR